MTTDVRTEQRTTVVNEIVIDAPPAAVYQLCSDIERWPGIFTSCQEIKRTDLGGDEILMEMRTRTSLGEHTIRSHRWNRPADLRIDFEMLTLPPEIAVMDGSWTVEPVGGKAKLVLVHNFRPAPDNGIPLPELSAMLHQTHERVVGEYKKWLEAARGDEPGDAYGRRTAANTIPAGTFENCELFFARLQQAGLTWGDITHALKDLKKESTLEDWADWHRRGRAGGDGYERRATEAFEAGHLETGRHSIRNAAACYHFA